MQATLDPITSAGREMWQLRSWHSLSSLSDYQLPKLSLADQRMKNIFSKSKDAQITPTAGDKVAGVKDPNTIILEKRVSRSTDAVNVTPRDFAPEASPPLVRANTDPLPARPHAGQAEKPPLFEKPQLVTAKTLKEPPGWLQCFTNTVRYSPLNILLVL